MILDLIEGVLAAVAVLCALALAGLLLDAWDALRRWLPGSGSRLGHRVQRPPPELHPPAQPDDAAR